MTSRKNKRTKKTKLAETPVADTAVTPDPEPILDLSVNHENIIENDEILAKNSISETVEPKKLVLKDPNFKPRKKLVVDPSDRELRRRAPCGIVIN